MDKYEKLKEEAHTKVFGQFIDALTTPKSRTQYKTVKIYQVDYAVGYLIAEGEVEIQSIDTITDIEDVFKDRFVTMAIDGVEEQIRAEKVDAKEYKAEQLSDSSRGN